MSIVRIDNPKRHTHGYQARAYMGKGEPKLTQLCSDGVYGGEAKALEAAVKAEGRLQQIARRMKARA